MTPPRTIFIDGERIVDSCTGVTNTIDASGQFLIPGLVDSHLHLRSLSNLEDLTSYGVTTALEMNCQNYTACALFKGHPGLSDFMSAGIPVITPGSPHANGFQVPADHLFYPSSDPDEWVRNVFGNNSDYLKIVSEPRGPSPLNQTAVVRATHSIGKQAMTHAADVNSFLEAIASGTDGLQHIANDGLLPQSAFEDMKRQGQFVTPTLSLFKLADANPILWTLLRGFQWPNISYANVQANVATLHRYGIPILAGTDAVGALPINATTIIQFPHGLTLHRELGYLVEAGLSPAEAINAATSVAAKYHRLTDRGVIAHGLRADLLLLKSNPLLNISNTLDIARVWVAGRE